MAQENSTMKNETNEKSAEYLYKVFALLKRRESIALSDKETHFGNTELRLLFEILMAKYEGKRLISTQLSKRIGVTRSAISQIVNRLEKDGVVKRVADDVDRKIAYIEITEETMAAYERDLRLCQNFLNRVVLNFGEENFNRMTELFDGFIECIEKEKRASKNKV